MSTATIKKNRARGTLTSSYLSLIREFPLRPITTGTHYHTASQIIDRLAIRGEDDLDTGERDYLAALSVFVERYDEEHFPMPSDGTPLENLKVLMAGNGMKTIDLGKLIGNRGLASLILNGKRELSKSHIRLLADRFKVSPALFI